MIKKLSSFPVTGTVKIFELENPWVYISVPKDYTEMFADIADRGLVAIAATLGGTTWNTSLMPMGDGTQFIPLSKKVRKAEGVEVGDEIEVFFTPRVRWWLNYFSKTPEHSPVTQVLFDCKLCLIIARRPPLHCDSVVCESWLVVVVTCRRRCRCWHFLVQRLADQH